MIMDKEYIEYLHKEIKHFDKELISILGLPNADKLRERINKDKKDTKTMLNLYAKITKTNETIRQVKADIRDCIAEAKLQLKRNVKNKEKQVKCIVCHKEKPESEMDNVNICESCRTMGSERY